MTTGSGGLQRHENADIFVSNQKEHFMGTIITKSDKEVLHFFDEMKRISDLIDHLPADNRHLLDGENYLTDTELAGKLKLSKRTLLDYRSNGILPWSIAFHFLSYFVYIHFMPFGNSSPEPAYNGATYSRKNSQAFP